MREDLDVSRGTVLADILETPALHKSLAVSSCQLFFSSNINARYNLWRKNLCDDSEPIEILSNDSLSPFRLGVADGRIYFISDRRGNSRYQLYFLDTETHQVSRAGLPPGWLATYAVSPGGEYVAVVQLTRGGYRLYVGSAGADDFEQVFESPETMEQLVWHPSAKELLFTQGRKTLSRLHSGLEVSRLFEVEGSEIGEPAYSPSGTEIAYVLRSGPAQSALTIGQVDSREVRVVRETHGSVLADPLWLDDRTLVLREVQNDEYLLRRISLEDGATTQIGPPSGVVYGMQYEPVSDALWFVAASETRPATIYRLVAKQSQAEPVLRLDWVAPDSVVPSERRVIDASQDVVVYHYRRAEAAGPRAAIIWLHGGSNRFSPRWNPYAQYFANSGYDFVALNYSEAWPTHDVRSPESFTRQAEETESFVRELRSGGSESVFLLGVSKGTLIAQQVLRRNVEAVDGVIEYSPVDNPAWSTPQKLAPLLSVTGGNDSMLDHRRRRKDIEQHRSHGSEIEWIVYEGEGHDLRGRKSIEARFSATLRFLDRLSGRKGDRSR